MDGGGGGGGGGGGIRHVSSDHTYRSYWSHEFLLCEVAPFDDQNLPNANLVCFPGLIVDAK